MNRLEIIIQHINRLLEGKDRVIVAIDGPCTSGKTTLAAQLKDACHCQVFHMDEFFLRPEQRTAKRYAEAGGNIDYERFKEEVLDPLTVGEIFSYRPFDCKTMTLADPVVISPETLIIIEGSYSLHPYFKDPYDLKILLTVDPDVQNQRIMGRPAHLHRRFLETWIPMERHYLESFRIADKADLIL